MRWFININVCNIIVNALQNHFVESLQAYKLRIVIIFIFLDA